ncbi:TetR/AcrR family transcriptional regulator [Anaerolentibacter hominis]|uniref:TetR/AcrR family transcriptional regulator n=1 Tax=Anaerolentibacter hominis TaxID=3079009 RepID=UPI0031B84069
MAPKAKITNEMILNAVLDITREMGFETVNARSIANKLQCSTRPIFTCFENMDELKKEFLAFAYRYYEKYVEEFRGSAAVSSCLVLPVSYIEFAQEETHLFKLLFINDMDLTMTEAKDFYNEADNQKRAEQFAETIGVGLEPAKLIFLDLFLYAHGIAVLTATKKLRFGRTDAAGMVQNVLTAFIRQQKPDWNASI